MEPIQKIGMFKRTPRNPFQKSIHIIIKILSKSVCDYEEKTDLFICNMVTIKSRKEIIEKVRLNATVRDSNL